MCDVGLSGYTYLCTVECVCVFVLICVFVCLCAFGHYVCLNRYIYVCAVCVCVNVYMCVCVCARVRACALLGQYICIACLLHCRRSSRLVGIQPPCVSSTSHGERRRQNLLYALWNITARLPPMIIYREAQIINELGFTGWRRKWQDQLGNFSLAQHSGCLCFFFSLYIVVIIYSVATSLSSFPFRLYTQLCGVTLGKVVFALCEIVNCIG